MADKIKHFTDLIVWQKAHRFSFSIYSSTANFPKRELFGITNQLRRAAASITANIAEGMGRGSYPDRLRFFYNARGSSYEVESYLLLARDLNYFDSNKAIKHLEDIDEIKKMLNAFIAKTQSMQ